MLQEPSAASEFKRIMEMPTGLEIDGGEGPSELTNPLFFFAGLIQVGYKFILFILSLFTFPVEVFIRKNLGERYFTLPKVLLGFVFLNLYTLFVGGLLGRSSILIGLVLLAYLVLCAMHAWAIRKRKKAKRLCHSRYLGDSLRFWQKLPIYEKIGQYGVQRWLEPSALIGLGVVFFFITKFWGVFLLFSGFALFLKHYAIHREFVSHLLNTIDKRIEGEQLEKALTEWTDPADLATDGYVLPPFIITQSPGERLDFLTSLGNLSPELQQLYNESTEGKSYRPGRYLRPKDEEPPTPPPPVDPDQDPKPPVPMAPA